LIDLLRERQVQATFFLNAKRSLDYPERAGFLADAGQEVACHTMEHLDAWRTVPWRILSDVSRAYQVLDGQLTAPRLYRPPYGRMTMSVWLALRRRGVRIAFWTHDSGDTHAELPTPVSVVDGVSRSGGGVVLLHSFDRTGNHRQQREQYVLEVTDRLLRMAAEKHLQVCCFSGLFE
jgi:peptidoglycan/xylan/chitin deacetylase (PgdA/CDA1 family)